MFHFGAQDQRIGRFAPRSVGDVEGAEYSSVTQNSRLGRNSECVVFAADKEAMTRLRSLLTLALGTLAACSGTQSTVLAEKPRDLVTVEAGENGLCHVRYLHVDRRAPCTEIVALMSSQLRIALQANVVVRASQAARCEEVAGLLQSLRESGYTIKVGYINAD